jgi:hypothetical protein
MLAAALLALVSVSPQTVTLELYRGASLSGEPFGYWDVTDTYVDGQNPDTNYGGEGILQGGTGRVVLIKFGDLDRAVGANRKVRKATLEFVVTGRDEPVLRSVGRLEAPWGEGPTNTLASLLTRNQRRPGERVEAPKWSATYRHRRAGDGGATWQQAGVSGPGDVSRIEDARSGTDDGLFRVTGLEGAVQRWIDRWYDNHGLALTFQNTSEFYSSQSPTGRPKLVLELEPADPKRGADLSVVTIAQTAEGDVTTYTATIKNVGDAPATAFSASWYTGERRGATLDVPERLEPGATATLTTRRATRSGLTDHRLLPLGLRITPTGPDASASNDYLEVFEGARSVEVPDAPGSEDWVQHQVRLFNGVVSEQSRYSFAPEGSLVRLNVVRTTSSGDQVTPTYRADANFLRRLGTLAGLRDFSALQFKPGERNELAFRGHHDMNPGIMGYGDTRFEGSLLGSIGLLYEPYPSPLFDLRTMDAPGLLSATDVAILNSGKPLVEAVNQMPKILQLRAFDLNGRPLANTELSFFQSKNGRFEVDPPLYSVVTDRSGTALVTGVDGAGPFGSIEADGGNGAMLVGASANGVTEWAWVKFWQLVDMRSRTGIDGGSLDLRFNLPGAPIDSGTNLAQERLVSDSLQTTPANLAALVDGDGATRVTLGDKEGDWIEIDLGRDRTIGEVRLLADEAMWTKFDIVVYATGQEPSQAMLWAKEIGWPWALTNRPDQDGSVAYRSQPIRVRYVRIINRGQGKGALLDVRVAPARQ